LHIIKEILYLEKPIKEVLDVEMAIETREVNVDPNAMGIFLSP
jgi:hypothetical protein